MQNNENMQPEKKQGEKRQRRFVKPVNTEDAGLSKKTVAINRITKVVKGGRTLRFSALVVVGDKNGKVGIGSGKAAEISVAVEKATQNAKKNMVSIAMEDTTIPHEIIGKFGRSIVKLMPAKEGSGIIAGGSARPVVELAGIKDVTSKAYGSRNKINCVKATLNGLLQLKTKEQIASLRGKSVNEIL